MRVPRAEDRLVGDIELVERVRRQRGNNSRLPRDLLDYLEDLPSAAEVV